MMLNGASSLPAYVYCTLNCDWSECFEAAGESSFLAVCSACGGDDLSSLVGLAEGLTVCCVTSLRGGEGERLG